ncbi:hypothetical protein GCM10010302_26690 [Streptomyces polychromogenes]|uniref:Uncharacterized protein n=1 Tax=Streptomyces polychromogenes TaxID=67342 RepID=A0ABN0VC91_9ACTN
MITNRYKQLAEDAAGAAYANPNISEEEGATANGLAAIAYALLHLAEVIEDKEG